MPPITVGLGVALGLVALLMRRQPEGQRFMSAASGGVALLMLLINVLLLHEHLDVVDPTGMLLPGWHLVSTVAGLGAGGVLGWFAAGRMPTVTVEPPPDVHEPVREPTAGETVHWRRTVTSPAMVWLGLALLPLPVVLAVFTSWWMLVVFVPVLLPMAVFARATVVVDESGLTIHVLTAWPRIHVPVPEIRAAHSRDIDPLRDFGGWGWRSNSTASGVVLRASPGLWVYRRQRGPLVVTVPDAEEAAALLNGLRDRRAGQEA